MSTTPVLFQLYTNLEKLIPGIDTNPANINPGGPIPVYFNDEQGADGSIIITVAGRAFAAGLSKRSFPLPAGVTQFTLNYKIKPSQLASVNAQAHETDVMFVDAKGNRYNGSMRKNNQTGEWEIADSLGNWISTLAPVGLFASDEWTAVEVIYKIDFTKLTLSVISIKDGNTLIVTPTALQNIAATQNSGWQPSIIDIQIQDTLLKAGSYTRSMIDIGVQMQ